MKTINIGSEAIMKSTHNIGFYKELTNIAFPLLAHLSRRLKGELIVYQCSGVVVVIIVVVVNHFQT